MWQWIDKVSDVSALRAQRVLMRVARMPRVIARWRATPSLLALLVEGVPDPSVVIGGPEAIEKEVRPHLPAALVQSIRVALDALWTDPAREQRMLALIVMPEGAGRADLVAIQVERDAFGPTPTEPPRPAPLATDATPDERLTWLKSFAEIAMRRIGAANMRAAAAQDEVAIVAVENDGELQFGYRPRSAYAMDFPEPVRLLAGEAAACWAVLVDMGSPGDSAPYLPFRMMSVSVPERGMPKA